MEHTDFNASMSQEESPLTLEEQVSYLHDRKGFSIGIPKESFSDEYRVAIVPDSVGFLVKSGIKVIVQRGAGSGVGYTDECYASSGAELTDSAAEVFRCHAVAKVSFPQKHEVELMRSNGLLISNIYCNSDTADVIRSMIEKKLTAIAFERITGEDGHAPIQKTLEQIAGKAAVFVAAELLSTKYGGKGLLLCDIPGIEPVKMVVLGSGVMADAIAKTATSLGVSVTVLGMPPKHLGQLGNLPIDGMLYTSNLAKHLESADVVIGTVDPIDLGHFTVDEEMVKRMKKGAIIIDVLADKGGCFSSTKARCLGSPTYEKYGVVHFCVPNLSSLVAHSASAAISSMLLPLLLKTARVGSITRLLKEEAGVCNGTYLFKGILTNQHLSKHCKMSAQNINILLAAL